MESNDKFEFIDWGGVDEAECSRVQNILFGEDKSISVPTGKTQLQPGNQQARPPPQPQHQQQQQIPPQMNVVQPAMVTQAQWQQHPGMEMAPTEQAQPKQMMYPVVMSQSSMVSPSQYTPVLMQTNHQNMMYMVPSPAAFKKEDDYGAYQRGVPPPQMPHAGHSLYIGHPGYPPTAYNPSQLYYSHMYMSQQMQPELPPQPNPAEMYMQQQQQQEPLNLMAGPKEAPVIVNTEASILQPNAPAFLPSYQPSAKPPPTFNNNSNNLQLRPTAPAFQPPPQEVIQHVEAKQEPVIVEIEPEEEEPEPEVPVREPTPVPIVSKPEPAPKPEPKKPEVKQQQKPPAPVVVAQTKKSWASIVQAATPADIMVQPEALKSRPVQAQQPQEQQASSAPIVANEDDSFSLAANNNNNNISKTNNHLAAGADDLSEDPYLVRLGEYLSSYVLDHHSSPLQPRGLTNRSNWCYINATLQAMVACPPFYNLIRSLPFRPRNNSKFDVKSKTPIIDAIMEFMQEFNSLPPGAKPARREKALARKGDDVVDVLQGPPFEPSCLYAMLGYIKAGGSFKGEGRQEDAEEFLGCLLNSLSDEMMDLMKLVEGPESREALVNGQDHAPTANGSAEHGLSEEDEDSWTVMKSRNRACVTRRGDFGRSPVSDIFRGKICSTVLKKGEQPTENVTPFYTLQLDIERASSVKEALEQIIEKARLEGVNCPRTQQPIEAWKFEILEELPPVLMLHLKWFNYQEKGCSKIMKTVEYSVDLRIENKILSGYKSTYTAKQKLYKLFAVVYHDGKEASKGHYITDAYNSNLGIWIRYDDSQVRVVPEHVVLHPKQPSVPYVLYYRRSDTMGQPLVKPADQSLSSGSIK